MEQAYHDPAAVASGPPAGPPSTAAEVRMLVYLNGDFIPKARATVSVDDRGFIFGDGVYEVIRTRDGHPFEAQAHLDRLAAGINTLEIPGVSRAELRTLLANACELLAANGCAQGDATIYLQVTRGAAPRSHRFPVPAPRPTIYAAVNPLTPPTALQERGVATITHPDIRWARCDVKTINLVPNVLAKQRAAEAGAAEAIFIRDGAITDGASTNVFLILDGELHTPPLSNYLLPGVTRRVVLDLAAELGITAHERSVFADDIARADEVFLTGTTSDVMPVREIDGRRAGGGAPGPITLRLQDALEARLAAAARAAAG